jgi:hypothetical protein
MRALIASALVAGVMLALPAMAPVAAAAPAAIAAAEPALEPLPPPPTAQPAPPDPNRNCAGANRGGYPGPDGKVVPVSEEIIAEACYTREGDRATVTYRWSSVGPAQGDMTFQLLDCTANVVEPPMTYTLPLGKEQPSKGGSGHQWFTVKPGHQYRPQVFGRGTYDRSSVAAGGPAVGGFSREGDPSFSGAGHCQ